MNGAEGIPAEAVEMGTIPREEIPTEEGGAPTPTCAIL
jgi:hypothetical protein